MESTDWNNFFVACSKTLGVGSRSSRTSENWCAWTTFTRLTEDAGYWTSGLPLLMDVAEDHIRDGGIWQQPFSFRDLAHVIIPRRFYWESSVSGAFESGFKEQPIEALSEHLAIVGVPHRVADLILEVKCY